MATPPRPPRKAGNPPESEWRSTPAAKRGRKLAGFTLSAAAIAEVELQAEQHGGNKSAAVEAAIWAQAPPERRPKP